jgi:hypothetical protein
MKTICLTTFYLLINLRQITAGKDLGIKENVHLSLGNREPYRDGSSLDGSSLVEMRLNI